jgi:hypothetical protein
MKQRKRGQYWRARLQYSIGVLVELGVLDPAQAEALEASAVALNSAPSVDLKGVHAVRFLDLMAEAGHRLEAIEDDAVRETARAAGRRLCILFFEL